MYICIYVYMYICIYVYMYICKHCGHASLNFRRGTQRKPSADCGWMIRNGLSGFSMFKQSQCLSYQWPLSDTLNRGKRSTKRGVRWDTLMIVAI